MDLELRNIMLRGVANIRHRARIFVIIIYHIIYFVKNTEVYHKLKISRSDPGK
jgi:hypothetical protein